MARRILFKNKNCIKHGCEDWENNYISAEPYPFCEHCGFNKLEAERRKKIPLVLCEDGLRRKILSTGEEE